MSKYLVAIPTYNEINNIEPLLKRLLALGEDLEIVFIDDNSPDGTADIIKRFQSDGLPIKLIERPSKLGLASAYLTAMKYALDQDYEAMIQMDADLSHPPEVVSNMIKRLDSHDLIIGSRYVPGGSVVNWSFLRRLLSRAGSLYAKLILTLPINDLTGGYNAWHRRIMEKMVLSDIKSNGYSFQIEMKHHAYELGAEHLEIPITFAERSSGRSKLSRKIVLEAIWRVPLIALRSRRYSRFKKFFKFSLVGLSGLSIDLIIIASLVEIWHWSPLWASVVSFSVAVVNNFLWNKYWTWRDRRPNLIGQFSKFALAALVGLLINFVVMDWLLKLGVHYIPSRFIVIAIIVFWNYFINSFWTFRNQADDLSTDKS